MRQVHMPEAQTAATNNKWYRIVYLEDGAEPAAAMKQQNTKKTYRIASIPTNLCKISMVIAGIWNLSENIVKLNT